MLKLRLSLVALLALCTAGCKSPLPQAQPDGSFSVDAVAEQIPNLDTLKAELKQYHDCTCTCGCYAKDLDSQANQAIADLRERAAQRKPGEKLALILDIDETTLSNYPEMAQADFAYNKSASLAWEDSGRAVAIPGTLRLYQEAQKLGVAAFFLTGRAEPERAATEQNLRAQGFPTWQGLILRGPNELKKSATAYKSAERARIASEGYTLAVSVGDQWSDLKGSPQAEFSIKYPNPYYLIP